MKRKRKVHSARREEGIKRLKQLETAEQINHPVLRRCYDTVQSLGSYINDRLPPNIRRRRKALEELLVGKVRCTQKEDPDLDACVRKLLSGVLVGSSSNSNNDVNTPVELERFSQQVFPPTTASCSGGSGLSISEIVDFTIWILFHKRHPWAAKPPHLLCHGLQRAQRDNELDSEAVGGWSIPGLVSMFPNENVETLKSAPWQRLAHLLGKEGESLMLSLLLDCGIFAPVKDGNGSYYQLSGAPISEVSFASVPAFSVAAVDCSYGSKKDAHALSTPRKASEIRFVRNRMFYAKAALNAKGEIAFGLRHIHVLNRFSDPNNEANTHHIMKYIFPRQFKLHNVFTSRTDPHETSQPFHDYTLREGEIGHLASHLGKAVSCPKRLRGDLMGLIKKMQKLHYRCSYTELLHHYCPLPAQLRRVGASKRKPGSQAFDSNRGQCHFTDLDTPIAQVSAFCQSAVANVFPRDLFGEGEVGKSNLHTVMRNVNTFVKCRRFESLTLEMMMRDMKVDNVPWLRPPSPRGDQKMSLSDFTKRVELLMELIYYIFDSFLIPLVRTNFHVTESSLHRNRLFYFRHDVWRHLTEPSLYHLKNNLFEQLGNDQAIRILLKRSFGHTQIRLLPKDAGMRPICNLKRRTRVLRHGSSILGKSINKAIEPAFNVLNLEKANQPHRLGSSLFSVTDIYSKLRNFRQSLKSSGLDRSTLYFVKVDVKSCFDTIPQSSLMRHVKRMLKSKEYSMARYTEIRPAEQDRSLNARSAQKVSKTFNSLARLPGDVEDIQEIVKHNSKAVRPGTIFVDSMVQQTFKDEQLLELLCEHVGRNIVKIGKKYYKQVQGIPQGSIMSSLFCNLFYADFEQKHLRFLNPKNSLLMRLIDDFLLITTDLSEAHKFISTMHAGNSDYGITISQGKSLVNFAAGYNGTSINQKPAHCDFPYCGMLIDTNTLDISKDPTTMKLNKLSDSLTVEYAKTPGQTFRRKMLAAVKIQMHTMLFDTSHNSLETVISNLHHVLHDSAVKCSTYVKSLSQLHKQRQSCRYMLATIDNIIGLVFAMAKSKRNRERNQAYQSGVEKRVVRWIGLTVFSNVFKRQRNAYGGVLSWLQNELLKPIAQPQSKRQAMIAADVVNNRRSKEADQT